MEFQTLKDTTSAVALLCINGTQENMAYTIGLPFGLVWHPLVLPFGLVLAYLLAYLGAPLADATNFSTDLRECSRVVKPEGWGARDRSSIRDVGFLVNANVFEFDARSLNHDRAISAKLGNSITVFVLFCILFDR